MQIHRAYLDNYLADNLCNNNNTGLKDVVSYKLSGNIETAVEIEPIARMVTEQVYYPSPERQMAKSANRHKHGHSRPSRSLLSCKFYILRY
jgi:hypothetical protein